MDRKIIQASAGLASLLLGALPAVAGDWNNGAGGYRDRGQAAVPVPAPVLVPDGPSGWYMRADVGFGRESNHGASEKGIVYGAGNAVDSSSANGVGFGSSSGWFSSSQAMTVNYGVGFGYSWGGNWRTDLTLDRRSSITYKMRGTYAYDNYTPSGVATPAYTLPTAPTLPQRIEGVSSDNTSLKSGVMLANGYYDWKNQSAFTPYVGLGVGMGYLDFDRSHSTSDTSCDPSELPLACATKSAHRSFSGATSAGKYVWAAALHAGVSYALSDVTSLDLNYRMLYMPGTDVDMIVNGYRSKMTINDIVDHEIRAGLRWNIN